MIGFEEKTVSGLCSYLLDNFLICEPVSKSKFGKEMALVRADRAPYGRHGPNGGHGWLFGQADLIGCVHGTGCCGNARAGCDFQRGDAAARSAGQSFVDMTVVGKGWPACRAGFGGC